MSLRLNVNVSFDISLLDRPLNYFGPPCVNLPLHNLIEYFSISVDSRPNYFPIVLRSLPTDPSEKQRDFFCPSTLHPRDPPPLSSSSFGEFWLSDPDLYLEVNLNIYTMSEFFFFVTLKSRETRSFLSLPFTRAYSTYDYDRSPSNPS